MSGPARGRDAGRGDAPLVYLVAGEPSGDALGAPLMAALKRLCGGAVRFAGVGGEEMRREGLEPLFPISDLAVMGLLEVVPRLPRILRRMGETARDIRALRPDVVVTIDSPDFSAGVWKRLGGTDVPLIHYVAPTVWAWRPGRVNLYARHLDRILVLLPFEPPYFERAGLPATFVGHPVAERPAGGDGPGFRKRHAIEPDSRVLCVLPGSRRGELRRLLPVFRGAVAELAGAIPGLRCVLPTVAHLEAEVRAACADWPAPVAIVSGPDARADAMAASDVALAASGTVTLELAQADVPMVIAYRINALTASVVRRAVRVSYVNLINLLLDRPAIPELLQERCRSDILAAELRLLLDDPGRCEAQREAARTALSMLRPAGDTPSGLAARQVLSHVTRCGPARPEPKEGTG